jgi:hypothetical protein
MAALQARPISRVPTRYDAEQKAMSLCRWDKHKNGGVEFGAKTASKS